MFDRQLTIDGREEDIAPRHEQPRMFEAPRTMRGQMAITHPFATPYCPNGGHDHWPADRCEACERFDR